jgi:hypothetical protein
MVETAEKVANFMLEGKLEPELEREVEHLGCLESGLVDCLLEIRCRRMMVLDERRPGLYRLLECVAVAG